jgi:hypothetical protein
VVFVAFRLENAPSLLLEPVYFPASTPTLTVPANVNPPPDRFTAFVDESDVPVNAVVVPPATCTLPETCDTANGLIVEEVMVAGIVTLSVPVCPPLPPIVP